MPSGVLGRSTSKRRVPGSSRRHLQPPRHDGAVDQGRQPATHWTRLSCHGFRAMRSGCCWGYSPNNPATLLVGLFNRRRIRTCCLRAFNNSLQDRGAADPAHPVLHPVARRKLLDRGALSADSPAHRAAGPAPDVIGREPPQRALRANAGVSVGNDIGGGRASTAMGGAALMAQDRPASPAVTGSHRRFACRGALTRAWRGDVDGSYRKSRSRTPRAPRRCHDDDPTRTSSTAVPPLSAVRPTGCSARDRPDPIIMLARIPVLDCAATLSNETEGLRNYLKISSRLPGQPC